MRKPRISIIAAVASKTRAIGKDNALLFRISEDLKRFRSLTQGHPVIMGRKTFESIGHPLPERENIVITRNPHWKSDGARVVSSLEDALRRSAESDSPEVFIIGGGEIFKQALPLADKLYLTIVESGREGDAYFPDWQNAGFTKEVLREGRIDAKTGLKYAWVDLERGR